MTGGSIEVLHGDLFEIFPRIAGRRKLKHLAALKFPCAQHLPLCFLVKQALDPALADHQPEAFRFDRRCIQSLNVPPMFCRALQIIRTVSDSGDIMCDKRHLHVATLLSGRARLTGLYFAGIIDQRPRRPVWRRLKGELDKVGAWPRKLVVNHQRDLRSGFACDCGCQ